jgi:superfamily II DNA or RNA helicase
LRLRPLGGSEDDATLIYLPLEPEKPTPATFTLPDPSNPGSQERALLLRDALKLKLRAGAGPFRSFGNLAFEPRAYQLVPLLMALKLDPIRLLIADDVGIGKTIEAGLILRELLDRGEIQRATVICPPHLCEQWQLELHQKFHIDAEVVRTGTASRLERGLRADESIFEVYPFTIVSLDYIKSERRRENFLRACPEFVIVDEAHTCVQTGNAMRHQRYELITSLARAKPQRHMLFLTATPHSGNDEAFHNLLRFLDLKFADLQQLPEGAARRALREDLAGFLVQRRRGDIAEWKDESTFPTRESREATYRLTGEWGKFFDDVLAYARTLVKRGERGSQVEQRMSWWAALALLRCISSSPAAAALALRTRLKALDGASEPDQLQELERTANEMVLDGDADDTLPLEETVPAGTTESPDDTAALRALIDRADSLREGTDDPKLAIVLDEVSGLVAGGASPIVFCRYISTAHYVAERLRAALGESRIQVICVTGELTAVQRAERIADLTDLEEGITPILVATDCLSEGVNLQDHFNAVVHYDLTWNPTRHEQREGRVDRFGQSARIVKTLMLYGQDNPVDGAVLEVIVKKAEKIRRELGVAVPLPEDNTKVVEAIMKAVLLHGQRDLPHREQLGFEFLETERDVDAAWEAARQRATRTVFAQRRLRPELVIAEWEKTCSVLGSESDVERFVRAAVERLGAPLERCKNYYRLPTTHLPAQLQERLEAAGFSGTRRLSFLQPAPTGTVYVHRSHPLVSILADYVAEGALDVGGSDVGARSAALFTRAVEVKSTIYLLRLRYHVVVETHLSNGATTTRPMLAEECVAVAMRGASELEPLNDRDALALFEVEAGRNMDKTQKSQLVIAALERIPALRPALDALAVRRAEDLLADHRRVREASGTKGLRYHVTPALPLDVIGVYVLLPMAAK